MRWLLAAVRAIGSIVRGLWRWLRMAVDALLLDDPNNPGHQGFATLRGKDFYAQDDDPGAVGVGSVWKDTDAVPKTFWERNAANDGWDPIADISVLTSGGDEDAFARMVATNQGSGSAFAGPSAWTYGAGAADARPQATADGAGGAQTGPTATTAGAGEANAAPVATANGSGDADVGPSATANGSGSADALSEATAGLGSDELQRVTPGGTISGGTWDLTLNEGTPVTDIPWNVSAAALQALIADADIVVSGDGFPDVPLDFQFTGSHGFQNIPAATVDASDLTGVSPTLTPSTLVAGGGPGAAINGALAVSGAVTTGMYAEVDDNGVGKIGFNAVAGSGGIAIPELPATPTEQDIADVLVALGLATQAAP